MKILIYVGKLGGGGAEHVAVLWIRGFIDRGDDVRLLVNKRSCHEYAIPKCVEINEVTDKSKSKRNRQFDQIKKYAQTP